MWPLIYNVLILPLLKPVILLISLHNRKIKASLQGKKDVWKILPQALKAKDPASKLIWFHAPSAGEFIQLQPLLERFLANRFDCVVTYNSISAETWIRKSRIKATRQPLLLDYLPFDSKKMIQRWLKLVQPSALVFIKYDLWPNAIWETSRAGIPTYLVSATLNQKTKRFTSRLGKSFYRNLYSHFKGIFVVEASDRKRFLLTNPDLQRVEIFGDIRYDATLDQRDRKPAPHLPDYVKGKTVFIVGSSWPPDEACVFPALQEALTQFRDLLLIVAPHEPTESHLKNSETFFDEFGVCRLSQIQENAHSEYRVILVDSVGVLSALYQVGLLGYVGGGFTTGVHNVMEPCAMGLPVFFGPIHYNSGEALQLSKRGLAFPVNSSDQFRSKLMELLASPDKIKVLGEQSKQFIEAQAGATGRSFQAIVDDLS